VRVGLYSYQEAGPLAPQDAPSDLAVARLPAGNRSNRKTLKEKASR
jgi:hypothetical protein